MSRQLVLNDIKETSISYLGYGYRNGLNIFVKVKKSINMLIANFNREKLNDLDKFFILFLFFL